MERARINLKIGLFVSGKRGDSERFFVTAYELYLAEVGAMDARTAVAAFQLSKFAIAKKDFESARRLLKLSIEVFESESGPSTRQMELTAHAFIIGVLEELGESDAAIQQIILPRYLC